MVRRVLFWDDAAEADADVEGRGAVNKLAELPGCKFNEPLIKSHVTTYTKSHRGGLDSHY